MDKFTFFGIVLAAMMIGSGGMFFALRERIGGKGKSNPARKRKPAKDHGAWMTRHQLVVLQSIAGGGRGGVPLWNTDLSGSTIRSLAKRGFVDTRSGGRIVATCLGRKRLRQPWPAQQPAGEQKDRGDEPVSGVG